MNRLFLLLFGAVSLVVHAQVPDYVPTEGLVAWYPFNGNANDESGNGNDGEVAGASIAGDHHGGQSAFYFNGDGDQISIPYSASLAPTEQISVSVWCNPETLEGKNLVSNGTHVNYFQRSYYMFGPNESGQCRFRINAGGVEDNVYSSGSFGTSEWIHVIGTYDGTHMKLYVNGQLEGTLAKSGPINQHGYGTTVGGNIFYAWSDYWFQGSIDDIGIWNRALTEDEILALYNAEPPVPGCTDSTACNFDAEATSDDGSCIPSGCMEPEACNYNALAECEGEACDYTCCPGPGCCSAGMYWDYDLEQCLNYETCQEDLDGDGVIGINDLMELLSSFGTMCEEPETVEFTCGDPMNYHGYDYATVQIGEQCWFAENLRGESYSDGEAIPTDLSDSEWAGTAEGAVSVYDGDMANLSAYGRLYNWYAVEDSRGLCPSGWHIPSDGEFIMLELELGMSEDETNGLGWRGTNQGIQLKSNFGWWAGGNGDDSIGFTALPGGNRLPSGGYNAALTDGNWWTSSSSESQDGQRMERNLDYNRDNIARGNQPSNFGFSVRCIKD